MKLLRDGKPGVEPHGVGRRASGQAAGCSHGANEESRGDFRWRRKMRKWPGGTDQIWPEGGDKTGLGTGYQICPPLYIPLKTFLKTS